MDFILLIQKITSPRVTQVQNKLENTKLHFFAKEILSHKYRKNREKQKIKITSPANEFLLNTVEQQENLKGVEKKL